MDEKKGAPPAETEELTKEAYEKSLGGDNSHTHILSRSCGKVNNELRSFVDSHDIEPKDVVCAVRSKFPSFDKPLLSRCRKPEKYGVIIHPEAMSLLKDIYRDDTEEKNASEAVAMHDKAKKNHGSSLYPCRIYGRCTEEQMSDLLRYIHDDGYKNIAAWILDMVRVYIATWKEAECRAREKP